MRRLIELAVSPHKLKPRQTRHQAIPDLSLMPCLKLYKLELRQIRNQAILINLGDRFRTC